MKNVFLTHQWGPGNRSCDLWQAVCFVTSAITDLLYHKSVLPPSQTEISSFLLAAILDSVTYMYKFLVELDIKDQVAAWILVVCENNILVLYNSYMFHSIQLQDSFHNHQKKG